MHKISKCRFKTFLVFTFITGLLIVLHTEKVIESVAAGFGVNIQGLVIQQLKSPHLQVEFLEQKGKDRTLQIRGLHIQIEHLQPRLKGQIKVKEIQFIAQQPDRLFLREEITKFLRGSFQLGSIESLDITIDKVTVQLAAAFQPIVLSKINIKGLESSSQSLRLKSIDMAGNSLEIKTENSLAQVYLLFTYENFQDISKEQPWKTQFSFSLDPLMMSESVKEKLLSQLPPTIRPGNL